MDTLDDVDIDDDVETELDVDTLEKHKGRSSPHIPEMSPKNILSSVLIAG